MHAKGTEPAGATTRGASSPGSLMRRITALRTRIMAWRPVRAVMLYLERKGPAFADAITYRALFSVFAALLLGFSAAGLWLAGNPPAWDALLGAVDRAVPGLLGLVDTDSLDPAALGLGAGLSIAGILSLGGLVGAALSAIGALRTALRALAGTDDEDVAWYGVILRNLLLAVAIAAGVGVSAVASVSGSVGIRAISRSFGAEDGSAGWMQRVVEVGVVFVFDALLVAALFAVLSGLRVPARALWQGAALGAVGLVVLQQLSGLFVRGAASNPLLASFAALIALLIWMNLSAQVILVASAYIVTAAGDDAAYRRRREKLSRRSRSPEGAHRMRSPRPRRTMR